MLPDPTTDELLIHLATTVDSLSEQSGDYMDRYTTAEAALLLLAEVRRQRLRLAELEALLEASTARRMPGDRMELPGIVAERKGGRNRREWRHDDLVSALVTSYLTDTDTGEITDPDTDAAVAARGVQQLLAECARFDWRMQPLRALGINPDDYCKSERTRRTVVITYGDTTEPDSASLEAVA